jgi:hypothetical protein
MSPSQALGIGPVVSPAKHGVLLRGLMKPSTQQKKVAVPVLATEAAEMFKKLFKRGPWPDKADCYRLAIDITAVKCAPPQAAKYADKNFADRLATFKAMKKLAHKQLKKARERSLDGLRLPELVYVEAFSRPSFRQFGLEFVGRAFDQVVFDKLCCFPNRKLGPNGLHVCILRPLTFGSPSVHGSVKILQFLATQPLGNRPDQPFCFDSHD